MDDLISRETVRETLQMYVPGFKWDTIDKIVDMMPSAEPERKKGIWLKTGQSLVFPDKFRNYFCSECGFEIEKTAYNYCPNCGADMRGEKDENNNSI